MAPLLFFNLHEFELNRGGSAEDTYHDAELPLVRLDIFDHSGKSHSLWCSHWDFLLFWDFYSLSTHGLTLGLSITLMS